ncbi:hypothetical protein VPH35_082179 [Triticum aestivum]
MCDQVLRGKPRNNYIQWTRRRDVSSRFPSCFPLCVHRFNGRSVYSIGCGLGGKLGHGTRTDEKYPRLIEQFRTLNIQPMVVAAGAWHAAVFYVPTRDYTTLIVSCKGDVYLFGCGESSSLGHNTTIEGNNRHSNVLSPEQVTSSGKVYDFDVGDKGQLGTKLVAQDSERGTPEWVEIDLS